MGLEETNEPKEAWKERSSKLMGSMWRRKVKMDHNKPEVMQTKKVKGW